MLTSNEFEIGKIIEIGELQTELVKQKIREANQVLFCDTDLITTQIYCQQYFGYVPDELKKCEAEITYDLYLLLNNDTPWVPDSLRDFGDRRAEMFGFFKNELEKEHFRMC